MHLLPLIAHCLQLSFLLLFVLGWSFNETAFSLALAVYMSPVKLTRSEVPCNTDNYSYKLNCARGAVTHEMRNEFF